MKPRPSQYHLLSANEKRTVSLARVRPPAVTCPACDTQVMSADLLAHIEQRCTGPREPGPGSKWVSWAEALKLGISKKALWTWVHRGDVRMRGERGERQYLHRDLVVQVARRLLIRRR